MLELLCVLHQMSAHYKNINDTKLYKSIVYNKSCDKDKVNLGQTTFSEDIGLTASLVERKVALVWPTCTGWRNSNWWLSSAVLCRVALRQTQVVDECNASVCSFVATLFHVLLHSPRSPPEWVLWLWALQWVIIHCEWIWSMKHITSSRNRFGITAFQ